MDYVICFVLWKFNMISYAIFKKITNNKLWDVQKYVSLRGCIEKVLLNIVSTCPVQSYPISHWSAASLLPLEVPLLIVPLPPQLLPPLHELQAVDPQCHWNQLYHHDHACGSSCGEQWGLGANKLVYPYWIVEDEWVYESATLKHWKFTWSCCELMCDGGWKVPLDLVA